METTTYEIKEDARGHMALFEDGENVTHTYARSRGRARTRPTVDAYSFKRALDRFWAAKKLTDAQHFQLISTNSLTV